MANNPHLKDLQFTSTKQPSPESKRKRKRKTIIKEALDAYKWENAEKDLERNIGEFLNSSDKKTRILASKYFAEFIKAKKKEVIATVKHDTVSFDLSKLKPDDLVQLSNMLKKIQKPIEDVKER